MPACNERFGGRRGVTRGTLYMYFESSVPVLTFAKPRPTAKPPGVSGKRARCTVVSVRENKVEKFCVT